MRSDAQIKSYMYTRPNASDPSLIVYYDFDDKFVDPTVTESWRNNVIGVRDKSPNKFDLLFGGCTPQTDRFCYNATCKRDTVPMTNCWGAGTRDEEAMPKVIDSNAPIGELPVNIVVNQGETITVALNGMDRDQELTRK